jgi:5'-3' exonuclease
MGIPYFFYNIVNKYKNIISEKKPDNIDIYAIDFNGLIHKIVEKNIDKSEDIMIEELHKLIIEQYKNFTPSHMYICTDGVAPLAKIIQQRKRRYLTVFRNKLDNITVKWDKNAISPNTNFMKKLDYYFKNNLSNNINYSGSDENGEGEHKIFDKLIQHNNDDIVVINGLDADLIILSLLSEKNNIYLMREDNVYLNINKLKQYIITELKIKWKLFSSINNKDLIESYCVMCSLLGNDFLPCLLTLNIKKGGLDKLLSITGLAIENNGLLVYDNSINYNCLTEIFERISETEKEDLYKEIENYNKLKPFKNELKSDNYGLKNKDILTSLIFNDINKWRNLYYKNIYNINIHKDNQLVNSSTFNYIKGIYWTYNYYKKFDLDYEWYFPYNYPPISLDIFNYIKSNNINCIENKGTFLNPDIQLLIILPLESIELIKDENKKYMTDISEGLRHLYPSSYKIQTFLKTELHECCPILPTLNINKIKKIII